MLGNIQNMLGYVTGGLFVLALLLLVLSIRFFRRSRTDVFWRRRRDAGQRGWRTFVLSFVLLVLSGVLCAITLVATLVGDDEGETPTSAALSASQTLTPPPTNTLRAADGPALDTPAADLPAETVTTLAPADTSTPVDTPTPIVIIITATPASTPTATPFPTFTARITPPVSNVTPQPDAAIRIIALDDQISDALAPVDPRTAFQAGTTRIYFFVEFTDMTRGVLWRRELYRSALLVDGGSYLWGLDAEGTSYFFFGNDSGFAPGDYDIRLFIGDELVNMASFTIENAP